MDKILGILVKIVIFIICMLLVVSGQRNIGVQGLATMLVGLAGLLGLVFVYNKAHQ